MRRVRIKQVPDAAPDADGEWIVREVPKDMLLKFSPKRWDNLSTLCDPGHHAVQYEYVLGPTT